jgi:hypothetical protein
MDLRLNRHDGTLVMSNRGASIYVRGEVYNLVHRATGPHTRVSPEDVQRIPWNTMHRVTGHDLDANNRPTLIRLHFTSFFRYQHYLYYNHSAFLALSTRNTTVRRILAERRRVAELRVMMAEPFAMGLHPRLGRDSIVQCLEADTLAVVVSFL